MNYIKIQVLLSLFFGSLQAQDVDKGPDEYLNEEARYICQRIAESETPIESLTSRGAIMLRAKQGQGLEAANSQAHHMKKLAAQGIEGFAYDGYVNLYLSQICSDYNRLLAVQHVQHTDDELKHKRFIALHNLMRDLMMAVSTKQVQGYVAPAHWSIIEPVVLSELSSLKKLRWTGSLEVIGGWRETGHFLIHLTDIDDLNHTFVLDVQYGSEIDSKITALSISEYTRERPMPKDTLEAEEVVPIGY